MNGTRARHFKLVENECVVKNYFETCRSLYIRMIIVTGSCQPFVFIVQVYASPTRCPTAASCNILERLACTVLNIYLYYDALYLANTLCEWILNHLDFSHVRFGLS